MSEKTKRVSKRIQVKKLKGSQLTKSSPEGKMKNVLLLSVLGALFCLPGISLAEKITVYSAAYPPYQIDDNGKLTGVNTEIVKAIFRDSGLPFEIKYVPWSRAQKYVGDDSHKNSAIYCLGRNEQREQKYKWVGVYFHQKVSFLSLKNSGVRINSLDDVKKYKLGLVRGDMMTHQLKSQGNVKEHEMVRDDILNIKKLFKGRVRAIVTSELATRYIARENGLDPDEIEVLYDVLTVGFNLALSKKTSDEVYRKLQASLNKLLKDGTVEEIINKWR